MAMHLGLYRPSHQPRKDQMRTYKNSVTFMYTYNSLLGENVARVKSNSARQAPHQYLSEHLWKKDKYD